ncbi:unnamed protein product [Amoebophrya sp. A120]|nr:unnamed protein product [Amoebophrya sp. A120]|eukprot:GSA120T00010402001.1
MTFMTPGRTFVTCATWSRGAQFPMFLSALASMLLTSRFTGTSAKMSVLLDDQGAMSWSTSTSSGDSEDLPGVPRSFVQKRRYRAEGEAGDVADEEGTAPADAQGAVLNEQNWFLDASPEDIRALCPLEDCKSLTLDDGKAKNLKEVTVKTLLEKTHPKCAAEFADYLVPPNANENENDVAAMAENREQKDQCLYVEGFHLAPQTGRTAFWKGATPTERTATMRFFAQYFDKIEPAVKLPMIAWHKERMLDESFAKLVDADCRNHVLIFEDAGPVLHKMVQNYGEPMSDAPDAPDFLPIRQELQKFKSKLRVPSQASLVAQFRTMSEAPAARFDYNETTARATVTLPYPPEDAGNPSEPICFPTYEIQLAEPQNRASIAVGHPMRLVDKSTCGGDTQIFPAPENAFAKVLRSGVEGKFEAEAAYVESANIFGLTTAGKKYLLDNMVYSSRDEFDFSGEKEAYEMGRHRYKSHAFHKSDKLHRDKPLHITVPEVLLNSSAVLVLGRARGDTYFNLRNRQLAATTEDRTQSTTPPAKTVDTVTDWPDAMAAYLAAFKLWQRQACPTGNERSGFLHGDPHLGNILWADGKDLDGGDDARYTGEFSFIDFGISADLPPRFYLCARIMRLSIAFLEGTLLRKPDGSPDEEARWNLWREKVEPNLGTKFLAVSPNPTENDPAVWQERKKAVVASVFAEADKGLRKWLDFHQPGGAASSFLSQQFFHDTEDTNATMGQVSFVQYEHQTLQLEREQQLQASSGAKNTGAAPTSLSMMSSSTFATYDDEKSRSSSSSFLATSEREVSRTAAADRNEEKQAAPGVSPLFPLLQFEDFFLFGEDQGMSKISSGSSFLHAGVTTSTTTTTTTLPNLVAEVQLAAFGIVMKNYDQFEQFAEFLKWSTAFTKRWITGYLNLQHSMLYAFGKESEVFRKAFPRPGAELILDLYIEVLTSSAEETMSPPGEFARIAHRMKEVLPDKDVAVFREQFLEPMVLKKFDHLDPDSWRMGMIRKAVKFVGVENIFTLGDKAASVGNRLASAKAWLMEKYQSGVDEIRKAWGAMRGSGGGAATSEEK